MIDLLQESGDLRERLRENTRFFREQMTKAGFNVLPGEHPIVPVMFGDAVAAARTAEILLGEGIYVVAFSYPVVPHGKARIRTQISAAHTRADLEFALEKFAEAKSGIRPLNIRLAAGKSAAWMPETAFAGATWLITWGVVMLNARDGGR